MREGRPAFVLVVGPSADPLERRAAELCAELIEGWTGFSPEIRTDLSVPEPAVLLGTPTSAPSLEEALRAGTIRLAGLPDEGYHLKRIDERRVYVAANDPAGVLYGAVELIERIGSLATGWEPFDPDIPLRLTGDLDAPDWDLRSAPAYPVRMTIESGEDPRWLALHRVNVSGAEGVWVGTGIDDGLGTAFRYVDGFESYQDLPEPERRLFRGQLRSRLQALRAYGVAPFLFFYVTGEPTRAIERNHPELLGPPVEYAAARNGAFYRPFCWSRPEVVRLFQELVAQIVRTYPELEGLHLRAWGFETRACYCSECGGNGPEGQEALWRLTHAIIEAARSVRPELRFILSGYDRSWWKDPDRRHLRRLPPGTILLRKWGADGEPTPDPMIPTDLLQAVEAAGHRLVILSHEAEEVQPLWMVEAPLFQEGVRRAEALPGASAIGGWTLQGEVGFGRFDRNYSARRNWDAGAAPERVFGALVGARYGEAAARYLVEGLFENGRMLSDFFTDYAGILRLEGSYRQGSFAQASRLWNLFGPQALEDLLGLPDREHREYARVRLRELGAWQQRARGTFAHGAALSDRAPDTLLLDGARMMEMWTAYFQARLALVEALQEAAERKTEQIGPRLDVAREQIARALEALRLIQGYQPLLGADRVTIKLRLLEPVQAELAQLQALGPEELLARVPAEEPREKKDQERSQEGGQRFGARRGVFCLRTPAEQAGGPSWSSCPVPIRGGALSLYSVAGRYLRRFELPLGAVGRFEIEWNGTDQAGRGLPNGVYFFRLRLQRDEGETVYVGRFGLWR